MFESQLCLLRGDYLHMYSRSAAQHDLSVPSLVDAKRKSILIRAAPVSRDRQAYRLSESQRQKLAPLDTRPWHTSSESRLVGLLTRTTYSRRSHHGHCSSESLLANTPPKGQRDPILGV